MQIGTLHLAMTNTHLATNDLRTIRHGRGLSIELVALLAGVDKSTISRAERGLQELGPETVARIARALKVSPSRIMGGGRATNL